MGTRFAITQESPLRSATIDETFARTWLAPCNSRGPNTRRARYYLLRRFCRFLAKRRPGTFVPGESLRPRGRPPKPPYIYSREEIRLLLQGALSLQDWESWHPCPDQDSSKKDCGQGLSEAKEKSAHCPDEGKEGNHKLFKFYHNK
jgi:hypothetical protein